MAYFINIVDHGAKIYLNVNQINFVTSNRKGLAVIFDNQGNEFRLDEEYQTFVDRLKNILGVN